MDHTVLFQGIQTNDTAEPDHWEIVFCFLSTFPINPHSFSCLSLYSVCRTTGQDNSLEQSENSPVDLHAVIKPLH